MPTATSQTAPQVPCPVCSTPARALDSTRYTAEDAATHHCTPGRDAERHARLAACVRRLWGQDTAQVLWCPSCGFGFGHPYVGGDAEFYSIIHEDFGYPTNRWEYTIAIAAANERFPTGGKFLDIGTGNGAFFDRLTGSWSRFAIESTPTLRDLLAKKGITAFASTDEATAQGEHSFHVISLFQCLEHVREFREMLTGIRRLIAPGGLLAVSVPNGDEIPRRERATRYPDMPPNHINKWTRKSLSIAFEQAGFRLTSATPEPARLSNVKYSTYLRVRADAASKPDSFAARAYTISDRARRARALQAVGLLTLPKLLPNLSDAKLSANLLALAEPA